MCWATSHAIRKDHKFALSKMVAEAGWNNWKGNLSIPMYGSSQKKAIWIESSILKRLKDTQIIQAIKKYFSVWIVLHAHIYCYIYILKLNSIFCIVSYVCKYSENIDRFPWHSLLNNCIPLRGQLAESKCCTYEFQIILERGGRHHFHKWSAFLAHTRPFTPSRSERSWREHYRICLNSSPSTWHQWAVQISSDLFCMALHITAISPVLLPRERFAQY